jgi:hypothetical protein
MDIQDLNKLKTKIELLDKKDQINILQLFKKHNNILLNENSNGTFINITDIDKLLYDELIKYISYIEMQKQYINKDEEKKNILEETYFKLQ